MVQLKAPFAILYAEISSVSEDHEYAPVPWGYERAPTFFRFTGGIDDPYYPKEGTINLPKEAFEAAGVLKKDDDFKALQAFFAKFKASLSEEEAYNYSVQSKKNSVKEGAKIYSNYMRYILKRANRSREFDEKLHDFKVSAPRLYASNNAMWPPFSAKTAEVGGKEKIDALISQSQPKNAKGEAKVSYIFVCFV